MKRITAVVMAMVLSFLLAACSSSLNGRAAVVNGKSITMEDLDTRLKIYELFFRQPMDNPASKQQLLDQMINERLILEQADRLQVSVTDAQVELEMAKFLGALDRQYGSRDEVLKRLQTLNLTNDTLVTFLRESLVSQGVVEHHKATVTISEKDVETFYSERLGEFYSPTGTVVRAAHVLLPPDQEQKAQEVAAKAKAGGDFAELARLYSVDPGSGRTGGDLGYFTRDTMVKEFAEAAFSLKVGEISEPVRSEYGWHVIRVTDKAGPGQIPFEKAKDDAANRLLPQKQDEAFELWLQTLQKAAKVEKLNLTDGPAKG